MRWWRPSVLPDDDQKHVASITLTAEKAGKAEPEEVTVTILPVC
jgi:hypothetical protein